MEGTPTTSTGPAGNGRYVAPAPGTRSAEEIRRDVVRQRQELARSVDVLRVRWTEATDIKAQLDKHRGQLIAGAAVAGALIGTALLVRRRRRRRA